MKKLATWTRPLGAAVCGAVLFAAAFTAQADWDPGQPAKWVQLPDLDFTGLDVLASFVANPQPSEPPFVNKILADDFLCTSPDKVTDIHIWGSWLDDIEVDPALLSFHLSIHSDVPAAQNPDGFSKPGEQLWFATMAPTSARVHYTAQEQFFDPNSGQIIGTDTLVWQYNFIIPEADAFAQQGTRDDPVVYWLDVQALVPADEQGLPQPLWGWKTSREHWNDDAVFGHTDQFSQPGIGDWSELRYPLGHPFEGQSIDLAFVITPEPRTYATVAGIGLVGFVIIRRFRSRR